MLVALMYMCLFAVSVLHWLERESTLALYTDVNYILCNHTFRFIRFPQFKRVGRARIFFKRAKRVPCNNNFFFRFAKSPRVESSDRTFASTARAKN
jgi:hypothetical protein